MAIKRVGKNNIFVNFYIINGELLITKNAIIARLQYLCENLKANENVHWNTSFTTKFTFSSRFLNESDVR